MMRVPAIAWLIAALALLPVMVSSQSLWIDEAQTVNYARLPALSDVVQALASDQKSEAMMPLPMVLSWVWARLLGTSELALRLPNLVYLALGISALWHLGVRLKMPALPLLFAVHPFLWQYADEARPYALQIGLGAAFAATSCALIQTRGTSANARWGLLIWGWLLSATSLLAVFPVVVMTMVLATVWWKQRWEFRRTQALWLALGSLAFLPLATFYLLALQRGSAGARLWTVGVSNLAFSIYELLGFQGLGPGRNQLREAALSGGLTTVVQPYLLPLLMLSVVIGLLLLLGRPWRQNSPFRSSWSISVTTAASTGILLLIMAVGARFPFWGRHLSPLLGFIAIATVAWISSVNSDRWRKGLLAALGCLWLAGALQVRFAERFAKDDYREAATLARHYAGLGQTVWWAADDSAGRYYGMHFDTKDSTGSSKIWHTVSGFPEDLAKLPKPHVMLLSKPDIYDPSGNLRSHLHGEGFVAIKTLPSFTLWVQPNASTRP